MSNESRRDESVDRLLRTSMRDALPGPTTACADEETLAAWADGGLAARERERVEAHVSSCANCQGLVAAFARSMPESVGGAAAAAPGLLGGWRLGWMMAVATGAALVTIWVTVPHDRLFAPPTRSMASREPIPQTMAPPVPPANADLTARPIVPQDVSSGAAVGRSQPAEKSQSPQLGVSGTARPDAMPAPSESTSSAGGAPVSSMAASPPPAVVGAIDPPLPPAPPPGAPIQAASGERSTTVARTQVENLPSPVGADHNFLGYIQLQPELARANPGAAERRVGGDVQDNRMIDALSAQDSAKEGVVAEIVPSSTALLGQGGGGGGRGSLAAGRGGQPSAAATVPAPVVTRWRIFANGQVDRVTTDAPAGQRVVFDQPVFMTAGSAPGPLVCWLVGRGGAVARTVDAEHFRSVAFPETADLRSVTAASALQATVITVAGATYVTTDGGATWRQFGR